MRNPTSRIDLDGFVVVLNVSHEDLQGTKIDQWDRFIDSVFEIEGIKEMPTVPCINGLWPITFQRNPADAHLRLDQEVGGLLDKVEHAWRESFKEEDVDQ